MKKDVMEKANKKDVITKAVAFPTYKPGDPAPVRDWDAIRHRAMTADMGSKAFWKRQQDEENVRSAIEAHNEQISNTD